MNVAEYQFAETDVQTAAGALVRIPAGTYPVEKRALVFRVRLGGREVDLTLAEFDRLEKAGKVYRVAERRAQ